MSLKIEITIPDPSPIEEALAEYNEQNPFNKYTMLQSISEDFKNDLQGMFLAPCQCDVVISYNGKPASFSVGKDA